MERFDKVFDKAMLVLDVLIVGVWLADISVSTFIEKGLLDTMLSVVIPVLCCASLIRRFFIRKDKE